MPGHVVVNGKYACSDCCPFPTQYADSVQCAAYGPCGKKNSTIHQGHQFSSGPDFSGAPKTWFEVHVQGTCTRSIRDLQSSSAPFLNAGGSLDLCELTPQGHGLVATLPVVPMEQAGDCHSYELTLPVSPSDPELLVSIPCHSSWNPRQSSELSGSGWQRHHCR